MVNVSSVWYKDNDGNIHKVQGNVNVKLNAHNDYPNGVHYDIDSSDKTDVEYNILYKKTSDNGWKEIDSVSASGNIDTNGFGNYSIKAQVNDYGTISESNVVDVNVIDSQIFGVSWNQSADPTLNRTDTQQYSDPMHDWKNANSVTKGIYDVTDDYGNEFVRIPKFYIYKSQTSGLTSWKISLVNHGNGWYLPKCFYDFDTNSELPYIDIGKWLGCISNDKLLSKSGLQPTDSQTIKRFRECARNNGRGYQQLDIHIIDVIQTLFVVTYGTLNSQSVSNGQDSDFFGIKSLIAKFWQYVDGIGMNNCEIWVCDNPNQYADSTFAYPYHKVNYLLPNGFFNGYASALGFDENNPDVTLPTALNGNETSYFCDKVWTANQQNYEFEWGNNDSEPDTGLFSYEWDVWFSHAYSTFGARLIKRPV